MKKEHYDILIIGSGISSSFFLTRILQKKEIIGKKILVLEKGYEESHSERKARRFRKHNGVVATKLDPSKTFLQTDDTNKKWTYSPSFGGSSNCWYGNTLRFLPNDFRTKSIYGYGIDWPLTYEELENYYSIAENIFQVSGPSKTPFPKTSSYPLPPHKLSGFDKLLQKKFGSLYIATPCARPSISIEQRPKCCNSGVCHVCPIDSKFTVTNSLSGAYEDPRVILKTEAKAEYLRIENGIAKSVLITYQEKEYEISADLFVLGANAIFNPFLLIRSGDNSPELGKGINEQVSINCSMELDQITGFDGSTVISGLGYMFYDTPERKKTSACLVENHTAPILGGNRWKNGFNRANVKFIFEDLRQSQNRIELDSNGKLPIVVYKGHHPRTQAALKNTEKYASEIAKAVSASSFTLAESINSTESHIQGTVPMGNSTGNSVVDRDLVHHKIRNLCVLGSSSFPTSPPANPSLTIAALSLRTADRLFDSGSRS
ncbi:GMC oxidoreductase [Leptospira sp. B5-022]|uniref:GMC oxidoreductase n=1 Tax=Leptospira sp. B5-022 TaxID=1242992 RepID=UPI0002BE693B|nr:GMC family oxidoreductase [Leptospira sp. B5-022]EMK00040.1 GMC oxidoreductase domain protein [Leptospira sp. B5-022]